VAEGLVRSSGKSTDLDMANNAPMTGKVHHKIPAALEVGSDIIFVQYDAIQMTTLFQKEYFMLDKDGKPVKQEIDEETVKAAEESLNSHSGYDDQDFITLKPSK